MALLSMLMLLLPSLASPALAMASGDKGFMAVATTLSETLYELSYMIEAEDSSKKSRRSSFTDEFLRASLLPKSKAFQRNKSPPPAHNLISRFGTTPTLRFQLVQHNTQENSFFQTLGTLNSFKTKDLLAEEKGNPADYASFWLVRGDGIYCHLFDKNGSPTRRVEKMLSFPQHLETDSDSFLDSETELSQNAMNVLMNEIVKQRQTKKAQVSVQKSFVTFGTILDKKHPVYYKIESDEPTNKPTKRRSYTMDLRDVYLLEETGTEFSHDDLPITYPLLEGQVLTTMRIYLYVRNIEEPLKIRIANELNEKNLNRPLKKLSPSSTPLYFPEAKNHDPVPQFHLNIPEEISPHQLQPVLDTLESLQDLQGHSSMHMYSFDYYFSPTDGGDNEFWLIDGKGIHRYHFNAHGVLVGKVNTMALWESSTLPVNPGSPQNNQEIQPLVGRLMRTLKGKRHAD